MILLPLALLTVTVSDADLHSRAIVIDTHADTAQQVVYRGADLSKPQPGLHVDLPKLRQGGVDAQFFSIWADPSKVAKEQYWAEALRQLEAMRAMVQANPAAIALASTAAEVRQNASRGLISAMFGLEGGHALAPGTEAEQLARLKKLRAMGVRYMTLTWANSNAIGGSSGDDGAIDGLTDFGRRVIDEMQRLGIVVDVSHASDPLFWDAVRYAKKPILATHSCSRALANVPRNLTDPMILAIAKTGGAVCVNFNPPFLDADYMGLVRPIHQKYSKLPFLEAEPLIRAEVAKLPPVPMSRLVDHIDHIAQVAGVDHVCLGSDFDGIDSGPAGLEDASKLPALTVELRKRGYSPEDVEKILGGNTLRVIEANEK